MLPRLRSWPDELPLDPPLCQSRFDDDEPDELPMPELRPESEPELPLDEPELPLDEPVLPMLLPLVDPMLPLPWLRFCSSRFLLPWLELLPPPMFLFSAIHTLRDSCRSRGRDAPAVRVATTAARVDRDEDRPLWGAPRVGNRPPLT
jgi:hypothetical protein